MFLKRISRFVLVLLLIEFLDELVFGAFEAAWPLIRDDLALSYAQIGLLLSAPSIVGNAVEPFLAVLGNVAAACGANCPGGRALAYSGERVRKTRVLLRSICLT